MLIARWFRCHNSSPVSEVARRDEDANSINTLFVSFSSKISAHEFERGGLLKPIVNTIDGTPTFLSVDTQNESQCISGGGGHAATNGGGGLGGGISGAGCCGLAGCGATAGASSTAGSGSTSASTLGGGLTAAGRPQRLSRNELKQLDEKQLIFELVRY